MSILFDLLPSFVFQLMLAVGALGIFILSILGKVPLLAKVIPEDYRLLGKAIVFCCIVAGLTGIGYKMSDAKWKAKMDEAQLQISQLEKKGAEVTTKVVTVYVDKTQKIKDNGDALDKLVNSFVTPKADAACTIPVGFVRGYNSAVSNTVPAADGASAPVKEASGTSDGK